MRPYDLAVAAVIGVGAIMAGPGANATDGSACAAVRERLRPLLLPGGDAGAARFVAHAGGTRTAGRLCVRGRLEKEHAVYRRIVDAAASPMPTLDAALDGRTDEFRRRGHARGL